MRPALATAALAAAAALAACTHASVPGSADAATPRATLAPSMITSTAMTAVVPSGGAFALKPGAISGRVLFDGDPPPIAKRQVTVDTKLCGAEPRDDRSLVVSPVTKAIRYAVVTLLPKGSTPALPRPAARPSVEQAKCEFYPYVTLVRPGGVVDFVNVDPGLHDLHRLAPEGGGSHDSSPPGSRVPLTFATEGRTKIVCDLHYWSSAWVISTDAPFAEITGADGAFSFENVPAGEWTLDVWQERLGEQKVDVSVPSGGRVSQNVAFTLPKSAAPAPAR